MARFVTAAASARAVSEDRAMVVPIDAAWLVCVADGTGGISGGAKAADLFVTGVQRAARRAGFDITSSSSWTALLQDLDQEIAAEPLAGETTGIALAVTSSGLVVGASCGDSRALLSTSTGWCDLTSHQPRKPRLGTGRAWAQPFFAEAHGARALVVGTDGLFDYAKLDDISHAVLHGSDDAADILIRLVLDRYRTPPDDIAIVVGWLD